MIDFELFLTQLKKPEAEPLTIILKEFLNDFSKIPKVINTQKKRISSFLDMMLQKSITNTSFINPSQEPDSEPSIDQENIIEGWEKLTMSKVYDYVFLAQDESRMNQIFEDKIHSYSWIKESHLDLPFDISLEAAEKELHKLSDFKAPRDKLTLLINFSQLVADLVKKQSHENAGNDLLLPCMILVIIRAKPMQLISHVKYIMRFRNQEKLGSGSSQFVMTNIMGAITFIYNLNSKSLTLTEQEQQELNGNGSRDSPTVEIQQLAKDVSGFFGNIFKEFKTISSGTANKVEDFVQSHLKPTRNPNPSLGQEGPPGARSSQTAAEEEEFELQMAMAMSLSLQEELKIDPEILLDLEKSGLNVDKMLLEDEQQEFQLLNVDDKELEK